jgi:hypothetical protein
MLKQEFMMQIKALNENYSEPYGERQIRAFWDNFKHIPAEKFRKAVDRLLIEEARRPVLQKFVEALNAEGGGSRMDSRPYMSPQDGSCSNCDGSGMLIALKFDGGQEFGFRCHCPRGQNMPTPGVPLWDDEKHGSRFRPLKNYETSDKVRNDIRL